MSTHTKKFIMKNIAIFSVTLNQGGIEVSILRFLKYAGKDANFTVFVRSGKPGVLLDAYIETGAKIEYLSLGYFNPWKFIIAIKRIRAGRFDTVCDYSANFAGTTMLASRIAGVKDRVTFYRSSSDHFKSNALKSAYNKFLNRLVYWNSTSILANSRTALNFFFPYADINSNKFEVIYNGIDKKEFEIKSKRNELRKEFAIPENAIVVGHTGRYSWPKNFTLLAKTAIEITSKYENVYFVFCGNGTDTEFLSDYPQIKDNSHIRTLGYRSDIPAILSAYDIFVFPSVTEGQPNSLIEALISGLPFVASDIAPIVECIPENLQDQLIDVSYTERFIEKVENLINNKDRWQALNCSEWAKKKFDVEQSFLRIKNRLDI